jgi:hypothetical protein
VIKENLEILFSQDPNVFIAGDLFWYPVEGDNRLRQAPDARVVFGRRADHEQQRAESFATYLRTLGVDHDQIQPGSLSP